MRGRVILIVDDEKRIREMLDIRLSSAGYEVIQAKDGEEGVAQARRHRPDLILMDVMMPKMDGGEAVKYLEKDPATKDIPVIFLTAIITREEEESQAFGIQLDTGKYRFIAKPFEPENLLDEIKKALEERYN
ncbi:MAG: response regulator [Candidatus Omnitrophica bacterium]|nr:response regulator [Candidatus Omnitrophota bacterium]